MSKKRFDIIYDCQGVTRLIDRENKLISLDFGFDWNDLDNYEKDKVREWLDVLNEQQATIEYLTKSRDRWRELSNSFSFYCKCYEKAIERAFEEKPYPTEDDINRIYAELEKELEDE